MPKAVNIAAEDNLSEAVIRCLLANASRQLKVPRLNFEVQHGLVAKEALIGCFVCMSFAGSVVQVLGDGIALGLG